VPFKSKAQQRKFFAMANRGEISKAKAEEWAHETPDIKKLPEHKKKAENVQEEAKKLHGIDQKVPGFKKSKGLTKKTAGEIALSILHKTAAISQQDIANALAGKKNDREITPEEVEAFRQATGRESGKTTGLLGLIGGGLTGALGGGMIGGEMHHPILGALGGAAAGGGLLGGLGYLLGRSSGREWGGHLGNIARAGELPSPLPYTAESYIPHALGKHEDLAAPMQAEDYDALKKQLAQEAMIQGALSGVASGGLSSILASNSPDSEDSGESTFSSVMRPIAYGAANAASARAEAAAQAQQIQDLYRRGYVDLANRLREEQGS